MTIDELKQTKKLQIRIITLSDRASRGEYEDLSGAKIKEMLQAHFSANAWQYEIQVTIIPDEAALLESKIKSFVAEDIDFIFTTGGTGVGIRDITPDTVIPLLDKEIPGIMEYIRVKYGEKIPNARLSRSVAGIIGQTQVYTLPGSVKAVKDYVSEITITLDHLLYMQLGMDVHK